MKVNHSVAGAAKRSVGKKHITGQSAELGPKKAVRPVAALRYTGPAAVAGQNRNILLATMFIGGDVSNDAGRCLELVEFLARLGVNSLEVAFERSVEHHAAGGRQGARPHRELLRQRPHDLAGLSVPGDENAHA